MGRGLHEIKFVDLKQSNVDWGKSDLAKGKYVFKPNGKKYIDYNSDSSALPEHKVQWNRNTPKDIDAWKYSLEYELVQWQDKHYWPEGIPPNAEGYYTFGDMILMQCPALVYAERKQRDIQKSQGAAKAALKGFQQDAKRDGVMVDEQLMSDLLKS
ncbi:MAG: hypothetical protein ACYTBV_20995 [Planctomycetota bacterium]|jgi:hypothetical protein